MANTQDATGKRTFDDEYTFPGDTQDLADDVHLFANARTGSRAEREALAPALRRPGLLFSEHDTGRVYLALAGGGWRIVDQDTKDVAMVLASGWSGPGSTHRVKGGFASINGRLSATAGAGTVLTTLPSGARPGVQIVTVAFDADTKIWHTLIINPSGSLDLLSKAGAAISDLRLASVVPWPVAP